MGAAVAAALVPSQQPARRRDWLSLPLASTVHREPPCAGSLSPASQPGRQANRRPLHPSARTTLPSLCACRTSTMRRGRTRKSRGMAPLQSRAHPACRGPRPCPETQPQPVHIVRRRYRQGWLQLAEHKRLPLGVCPSPPQGRCGSCRSHLHDTGSCRVLNSPLPSAASTGRLPTRWCCGSGRHRTPAAGGPLSPAQSTAAPLQSSQHSQRAAGRRCQPPSCHRGLLPCPCWRAGPPHKSPYCAAAYYT